MSKPNIRILKIIREVLCYYPIEVAVRSQRYSSRQFVVDVAFTTYLTARRNKTASSLQLVISTKSMLYRLISSFVLTSSGRSEGYALHIDAYFCL